jgi:drug/metabolite transporter (DMT)-like permease
MGPVLAALVGALFYGGGDFVGGLASRRIAPVRVVTISAVTGAVLLVPLASLVPGKWTAEALLWGAASGVANAIAIALLYAALAIGPMSILSPLTAVLSAAVPVAIGVASGERLSPLAITGILLALVGTVLVGAVRGSAAVRPSVRGLLYAAGSGIAIGVVLTLLDRAPDDSGLVPLLFNRATSAVVLGAVVAVLAVNGMRRGVAVTAGWRSGLALAIACGLLDLAANSLILLALRSGELGITSVVVALYPVGTILLAATLLKERLAALQWTGLALALAAVALLALG